MGPLGVFPPVIRLCSFYANSGIFRLRPLDPAVAPPGTKKQTPACTRFAGQLAGRLQANEAREKRALLGLAHRAEVDGRRGVRGGQHDGRGRGAKRSSSRGRRGISSRSRSRGSDASGAGSGKESGPASTQPAEKREPRRLAASTFARPPWRGLGLSACDTCRTTKMNRLRVALFFNRAAAPSFTSGLGHHRTREV